MVKNDTSVSLREKLLHLIDTRTKPPGSLGMLEDIALQVGLIQQSAHPAIVDPHIVVFAGDHGIAATGLVNPYPQEVTAQMVLNFLSGGAAINVFCRQHSIGLKVVDAGINFEWNNTLTNEHFIHARMGPGTANYLDGPAMQPGIAERAIDEGKKIVDKIADSGCNCIGFGEMGIGNSSSAALLMASITGIPIEECVGRGTGVNNDQLQTKIRTLRKVYDLRQLDSVNEKPLELLKQVGGFEIAMMTGAYLQVAARRMVIVVDGFIASAALLVAQSIEPSIPDNCIFAHTSGEQGHEKMLRHLKARPLLNLGMRLGEGTGAALAIPLVRSAVNFLREMASFDSAGVSDKDQQ